MKYKVGDTVRIQSREWIKAQKKCLADEIYDPKKLGKIPFVKEMIEYAGCIAKITAVLKDSYQLDIDNEDWEWEDWMFDPAYNPDEPLSPEDAIRAMLDGETLYNREGWAYSWDGEHFHKEYDGRSMTPFDFFGLHRRPEKRKRLMTAEEAIRWANSKESSGWMVCINKDGPWSFPEWFSYDCGMETYQRAKMRPDLSFIDRSTIQGFEVVE